MPENAFTAGVRPGGLTTSLEIRILLCYLIRHTNETLTPTELESALLSEELVNYFELATNLSELRDQGLISEENGHYVLLPAGQEVADSLCDDVPLSVRDAAVRAVQRIRQAAQKRAQHKVDITPCGSGFTVLCTITEDNIELFRLSLYMSDRLSAIQARERFIEHGAELYRQTLTALTDPR
jgi:hypothetical protein